MKAEEVPMKRYLCKECHKMKLKREMVKDQEAKDNDGVDDICRGCKHLQNTNMHKKAKKNKRGNYKENYTCPNWKNRDKGEMERPVKEKIVSTIFRYWIKYHEKILTFKDGLCYKQLGLDFPYCKKDGILQKGIQREIWGVLKELYSNGISTKIEALEIDPEVIESWKCIKHSGINIINGSWEIADRLFKVEKEDHLFIYNNTFGKREDEECYNAWKNLNAEVYINLCSLRNGNVDNYSLKLLKTFNNYKIYYLFPKTKGRGNIRLMILIRKDIDINLTDKILFEQDDELLPLRIYNLNDEYRDMIE